MDAERLYVVPGAAQRGHHVVFGLPFADLLLGKPLGRVRGQQVRVNQHQDAKPFHSAIHLRRDGPNNACMVFAVNSVVNSTTSLRSGPTARSFSFLQRAIMSSSTASTVSWYSPVHLATSSRTRVRLRRMNDAAVSAGRCFGSAENSRSRSRS